MRKFAILSFTFLLLFTAVSFLSCNSDGIAFKLSKLEGNWFHKEGETLMVEIWESAGKHHLKGTGKIIEQGEEQVSEYLELKMMNGVLHYIATLPDQNEGVPVHFFATSVEEKKIVFENPDHDFPQFISYEILDEMNMVVKIGKLPIENSPQMMEFNYSRTKP
jgi:hypothetical protein